MSPLHLKLALLFLGAPAALAGTAFGLRWLFLVGVLILVIALSLPTRPGQTLGQKLSAIARGFPLVGARHSGSSSENGAVEEDRAED